MCVCQGSCRRALQREPLTFLPVSEAGPGLGLRALGEVTAFEREWVLGHCDLFRRAEPSLPVSCSAPRGRASDLSAFSGLLARGRALALSSPERNDHFCIDFPAPGLLTAVLSSLPSSHLLDLTDGLTL